MKLGNYPLGSERSRAAARTRLEQIRENEPKTVKIAHFGHMAEPKITIKSDGSIEVDAPGAMTYREALILAGIPAKAVTGPEFNGIGTAPGGGCCVGRISFRYENGRVECPPGQKRIIVR